MLKRLGLKNFLSFRDETIEFGKINLFIGPNASGKSNLAKALRLLKNHFIYGIPIPDESITNEIPLGDLAHRFNVYEDIELEAFLDLGEEARYVLKLSRDGYEEKLFRQDIEVYSHNAGQLFSRARYRKRDGSFTEVSIGGYQSIVVTVRSFDGLVERININMPLTPLRIPPIDSDEILNRVATFFRSIGVFRFNPDSIRLRSNVSTQPVIGYDGSNLARFLLHIYLEKRKLFISIEEIVRGMVPEIEEIVPHIEGNEVEVWVRSKHLSLPIRPGFISDGTLRLIALAIIFNSGFSLVVVEEPENYIHPHLLEALADLARKSSSQIIFTTHSPRLLDFFKPEEVYIVVKMGAESRVRRLMDIKDYEIVKKFLDEGGTLGEAWISRFFGETI